MQENCVSGVTPRSRVEEMTLVWYLETVNKLSNQFNLYIFGCKDGVMTAF